MTPAKAVQLIRGRFPFAGAGLYFLTAAPPKKLST